MIALIVKVYKSLLHYSYKTVCYREHKLYDYFTNINNFYELDIIMRLFCINFALIDIFASITEKNYLKKKKILSF